MSSGGLTVAQARDMWSQPFLCVTQALGTESQEEAGVAGALHVLARSPLTAPSSFRSSAAQGVSGGGHPGSFLLSLISAASSEDGSLVSAFPPCEHPVCFQATGRRDSARKWFISAPPDFLLVKWSVRTL